jgi:hypothetical protein
MVEKSWEAKLFCDCSDRHALEVRKYGRLVVGRISRREVFAIVAIVAIFVVQGSELCGLQAV